MSFAATLKFSSLSKGLQQALTWCLSDALNSKEWWLGDVGIAVLMLQCIYYHEYSTTSESEIQCTVMGKRKSKFLKNAEYGDKYNTRKTLLLHYYMFFSL